MFRPVVSETPLSTRVADDVFPRITGEQFNRDVSFLSTLRALIAPRMSDEDYDIHLRFNQSTYTAEQIARHGKRKIFEVLCEYEHFEQNCGQIYVHNLCSSEAEDNKACLEVVEELFCDKFTNYKRLQKMTVFFQKSFGVMCFIDEENQNVVLFCESLNLQKIHYLQCAILVFLPWYFNAEDGVTELEMRLINSLRGKDVEEYISCIDEISKAYDFREKRIKMLLEGFETSLEKQEVRDADRIILEYTSRIESLSSEIGEYLSKKRDKEIWRMGLLAKIEESKGESEVMEYFLHNKNLDVVSADERGIKFQCRCYCDYWEEDTAETMIERRQGYVHRPDGRNLSNYIDEEDMEWLMNEIFIKQNLRIKFCSTYFLPLDGHHPTAIREAEYGHEFDDCMPNPHIDRWNCIGNYTQPITEALENHNYIGAIEQCVASCGSLNFTDSTVMTTFMNRFYGYDRHANRKCIELPDGRVVTPEEAIVYLKEERGDE